MSTADFHFGNFSEGNQRFINLAPEASIPPANEAVIYFRNLFRADIKVSGSEASLALGSRNLDRVNAP